MMKGRPILVIRSWPTKSRNWWNVCEKRNNSLRCRPKQESGVKQGLPNWRPGSPNWNPIARLSSTCARKCSGRNEDVLGIFPLAYESLHVAYQDTRLDTWDHLHTLRSRART